MDNTRSERNAGEENEEARCSKLQRLFDQYCVENSLPPYPPIRTPAAKVKVVRSSKKNRNAADAMTWTQHDTESTLAGVPFDDYLGLRLYHSDPIDLVNAACQAKGTMFVDHEFCVHDASEITVNGEQLTPGIITPLNVQDLANSGERKRVARIQHFSKHARRTGSSSEWTWVRGSSMPGRKVFASSDSVCSQNVIQGKVGNCGFCSGFASLAAQFPHVATHAFGTSAITGAQLVRSGAFSICLYPAGKKRFILLDDYVLCIVGTAASPSLHSLNENDLWIRLFEKIFVKLQSSYASLDGFYKWNSLFRHPARALQLITGAPIALELHYKKQQVDEAYKTLLATEGTCIRVAHGRKAVDGLYTGHGYSLLWVGTIAGVPLACVRNPHGKRSYTGEFGRGGSSWSTGPAVAVAKELNKTESGAGASDTALTYVRDLLSATHDNGIFLIRFDVFVECFPTISIVGPIKEKSGSVPLPGFEVKNCLYKLHSKSISRLCEMLNVVGGDGAGAAPL